MHLQHNGLLGELENGNTFAEAHWKLAALTAPRILFSEREILHALDLEQ